MKFYAFVFLLMICSGELFAQTVPVPPKPRHRFTVIAHRGSHLYCPENSLDAYAQAIKDGADYVEIDIRTTKDGQLISLHNATTTYMTGVNGTVKDMMLEELLSLRLRSNDSLDTKIYRIPTFEQILQICKDKIYLYIDLKDASAASVTSLLLKYGMEKQVLVYINSEKQYNDWRQVSPLTPLMISLPAGIKDGEGLIEFLKIKKPDLLDGDWKEYTSEMIRMSDSLRIPAWPDIQSKEEGPAVWQQAIERGFKGLQTDHPAQLIQYLQSKGLR